MRFSILLPTKNRARYLKTAIASCLGQTFQDYEIIVGDNNSSDSTSEVATSFGSGKIKYTRSEKDLTFAENCTRAFNLAQGQYFILMGDDDFLMPFCLEELNKVIEEMHEPDIIHYNDTCFDYESNTLELPMLGDGKAHARPTEPYLDNLFNFIPNRHPAEWCFKREEAEKVEKFYQSAAPDYFSCIQMLARTKLLVHLDKTLVIVGRTPLSLARKQQHDRKDGFGDIRLTADFPIRGNWFANIIYQTLDDANREFAKEGLPKMPINESAYFRMMARSAMGGLRRARTSEERNECIAVLKKIKPSEILSALLKSQQRSGKKAIKVFE